MSRVVARARIAAKPAICPAVSVPRTISGCARALLRWHGIDPLDAESRTTAGVAASITVADVRCIDGHLTMTLTLPMPYGDARMTIRTGDGASITFPGMTLSSAVTAATIGRPIGRLTGNRAFDGLDFLRVTAVRQGEQAGRAATILLFDDTADAIAGPRETAGSLQ
ncbi:hypothetical protein [Sphingomonas solaris]|nr:hypothetical protein [Sphingomonas solaris]